MPYVYPSLTAVTTTDFSSAGHISSTETDVHSVDAYGNVRDMTVTVTGGGKTFTTRTQNNYANNTSLWHLGRLARSTVTKSGTGQPAQARASSFTYDPITGLLNRETIEPDNPELKQSTAYGHDEFGNRTTVTVTGAGIAEPRRTTTVYRADGYFPETVYNALGHSESQVYDPRYGQLVSQTGPNGITTTWQYDAFGRKTHENRADGTTTESDLYRCNSSCENGESYYAWSQSSGSVEVFTYYDAFGREVRSYTTGFNNAAIESRQRYDSRGRLLGKTGAYFAATESPYWTCYLYDYLDRLTAETVHGAPSCNSPEGLNKLSETSYDGRTTIVTVHNADSSGTSKGPQTKTVVKNAIGQREQVIDASGTVSYTYDAFGNMRTMSDDVGNVTTMTYDIRGNKRSMDDPDMGVWGYTYNALGEMTSQTNALGQTTYLDYDLLGRMVNRYDTVTPSINTSLLPNALWQSTDEGETIWQYDTAANGIGKLASVTKRFDQQVNPTSDKVYVKTISYDALGRAYETTTRILGNDYTVTTSYDNLSRVDTVAYPGVPDGTGGQTRLTVKNIYDSNGYLTEVQNASNQHAYWSAVGMNASGQYTTYSMGDGSVGYRYYNRRTGMLENIDSSGPTGTLQALEYAYDRLGNLENRSDVRDSVGQIDESFVYDDLNRLTAANLTYSGITGSKTYEYDNLGNITLKSDNADTYLYGENGAGPHAVTTLRHLGVVKATYNYNANGAMTSGDGRSFEYTSFNKAYSVSKGEAYSTFAYNADRMRIVQSNNKGTTIYLDPSKSGAVLYQQQQLNTGETHHIHHINAPGGVVAEYRVTENTDASISERTQYWHKDHLGSTDVITDESGNVVERQSFGPFGDRRMATDWSDPMTQLVGVNTNRGYTGHEHLDDLGITHMNGRLYDAKLGRFLSADPFIQSPSNSQSLNRYSYLQNNPLNATDPSGYFLKKLAKAGLAWFANPVAAQHYYAVKASGIYASFSVGAAAVGTPWLAAGVSTLNAYIYGANTGQALKAGMMAFMSAQAAASVGSYGDANGWADYGLKRALAHGGSQAAISYAGGGDAKSAFLAAFAAKTINIGGIGTGSSWAPDSGAAVAARTLVSGIIGGTASVVGGGKFANGAKTAAFVHLYNSEGWFKEYEAIREEAYMLYDQNGNPLPSTNTDAGVLPYSASDIANRMDDVETVFGTGAMAAGLAMQPEIAVPAAGIALGARFVKWVVEPPTLGQQSAFALDQLAAELIPNKYGQAVYSTISPIQKIEAQR